MHAGRGRGAVMSQVSSGGPEVALAWLLVALAQQVHRLQVSAQSVENAVGCVIRDAAAAGRPLDPSLQGLDLLVQSLGGLAVYIGDLSQQLDPAITLDPTAASHRIGQRDLAFALIGRAPTMADDPPIPLSGSVHFF